MNKRIYIIIGASCAGKSSLTRNTWIRGREFKQYKDIVWVSELDDCFLIGKYDYPNRNRHGSDTISKADIKKILPQIEKIIETTDKDVVLEGVQITQRPLWNALIQDGYKDLIQLIYVDCSVETSIKRACSDNRITNDSMLKSMHTRCVNIYNEYMDVFDNMIIDSNDIEDFTTFNLYSYIN